MVVRYPHPVKLDLQKLVNLADSWPNRSAGGSSLSSIIQCIAVQFGEGKHPRQSFCPSRHTPLEEQMTKEALHSDRVVMINWSEAIDAGDVMRLMQEISRTRLVVGVPLIAILSIEQNMAVASPAVRAALVSCLPRILSQCQKFIVVLEPAAVLHRLLRAFFLAHSVGAGTESCIQLCDNLSEALEFAQQFAPQEVLELQRALLKHSTQSGREWS